MSAPSTDYAEAYVRRRQKLIEFLKQQLANVPMYVEHNVIQCNGAIIDIGDDEIQGMLKSIPITAIANIEVRKKVV